jgi:hypothetical protein
MTMLLRLRLRGLRRAVERVARDDPGSPRVRRAVDRLDRASRRAPWVVDVVWSEWLDEPAEPLTELLLRRWRQPAGYPPERELSLIALDLPEASDVDTSALASAAARSGHPIAATARRRVLAAADPEVADAVCAVAADSGDPDLVAFCVEHGLAPADPVRRAAFLLLTGQGEQYRAVDPDGALLARRYAAASTADRDRLRAGLVSAGRLDLVRQLISDARHPPLLRTGDATALAAGLAERQDWAELWRLLTDAPLGAAVDLAAGIPLDRAPGGDDARRLLAALRTAGAGVRAALADPLGAAVRLPGDGEPRAVSFAPDGAEVAVLARGGRGKLVLSVHALPGGRLAWQHRPAGRPNPAVREEVLHVGAGTVLLGGGWVRRVAADGSVRDVPEPGHPSLPVWATHLARVPGGALALKHHELVRLDADSGSARYVSPAGRSGGWPSVPGLVTEPGSGQAAVFGAGFRGSNVLVLLDGNLTVRAEVEPPAWPEAVAFVAPDQLVVLGWRSSTGRTEYEYTRWRRDGRTLVAEATEPTEESDPGHLALVPALGRIRCGPGDWRFASDLAPAPTPGLDLVPPYWTAPDGRWLAVPAADGVDVHRVTLPAALADLAARPITRLRRTDLAAVAAEREVGDPVAGAVADLLGAALAFRFGADVALGRTGARPVDEDAIALSDSDGAP